MLKKETVMLELALLELFKKLLDEEVDDSIANMFLELSEDSIKNYLKVDYLEFKLYDNVIVMLAVYLYKSRCDIGLESFGEGTKSIKYESVTIPKQIKAMLPKPRIRWL